MNTPISLEKSERAVLAASVRDSERLAFLELEVNRDDFLDRARARLYDLLIILYRERVTPTFDMLETQYKIRWPAEEPRQELDAIRAETVISGNWSWHVRQLRQASVRRLLIRQCEILAQAAQETDNDEDVVGQAQALAATAAGAGPQGVQVASGTDLTVEVRTDYFQGATSYVPLGMGPPTWPFRGVRQGEVFTLLARTWVGKSLWASQAVLNANAPALVISMEMPKLQWWERTVCQVLGLPFKEAAGRLATGRITPEEAAPLKSAEKRIAICDKADGTLPSLEAAVKRAEVVLKCRPKLVAIDYLQLLKLGARNASVYERASQAAVEVKSFAKRNEIAVLLLSQVGREHGGDGSTEVGMQSARDSGQIEEAADFLLGLWRPSMRLGLTREEYEATQSEIKGRLIKNRRGKAFDWSFSFNQANLRITPV